MKHKVQDGSASANTPSQPKARKVLPTSAQQKSLVASPPPVKVSQLAGTKSHTSSATNAPKPDRTSQSSSTSTDSNSDDLTLQFLSGDSVVQRGQDALDGLDNSEERSEDFLADTQNHFEEEERLTDTGTPEPTSKRKQQRKIEATDIPATKKLRSSSKKQEVLKDTTENSSDSDAEAESKHTLKSDEDEDYGSKKNKSNASSRGGRSSRRGRG
jgi:hypothetical protein